MSNLCYHIASLAEYEAYKNSGSIAPGSLSTEGFVHLSFADQLEFVLGSFFRGRNDLVLLELVTGEIEALRLDWVSEAKDAFPHVYGSIPWKRVRGSFPIRVAEEGPVSLPPELLKALEVRRRNIEVLESSYPWTNHVEGMRFVETVRNETRTSGHYWFMRGSRSVFHRVMNGDELWLIHSGSLELFILHDGELTLHRLGNDLAAGERPSISVPRGALQAARLAPHSDFAFGSNVCAPPFEYAAMEIPTRADLVELYPRHEALLVELTHESGDS